MSLLHLKWANTFTLTSASAGNLESLFAWQQCNTKVTSHVENELSWLKLHGLQSIFKKNNRWPGVQVEMSTDLQMFSFIYQEMNQHHRTCTGHKTSSCWGNILWGREKGLSPMWLCEQDFVSVVWLAQTHTEAPTVSHCVSQWQRWTEYSAPVLE